MSCLLHGGQDCTGVCVVEISKAVSLPWLALRIIRRQHLDQKWTVGSRRRPHIADPVVFPQYANRRVAERHIRVVRGVLGETPPLPVPEGKCSLLLIYEYCSGPYRRTPSMVRTAAETGVIEQGIEKRHQSCCFVGMMMQVAVDLFGDGTLPNAHRHASLLRRDSGLSTVKCLPCRPVMFFPCQATSRDGRNSRRGARPRPAYPIGTHPCPSGRHKRR